MSEQTAKVVDNGIEVQNPEAQAQTPVVETPTVEAEVVVEETTTLGGNNEFTMSEYKRMMGIDGGLALKKQETLDQQGNQWYNAKHSDPKTGDLFAISIPEDIYSAIKQSPSFKFLLKAKPDVYRQSGDPYIKHTFGMPVEADDYL